MTDKPYAAHERLVAPARSYPQLWRLIAGMALVASVTVVLNLLLHALFKAVAPSLLTRQFLMGNAPGALLFLLFSFGTIIAAVALAAPLFQHRGLASVIGPMGLALSQFWRVFRALVLLGVIMLVLPPYDMGSGLVENLDLSTWLLLLPFSLAAILVQTASEEILFRGYLQQGLAARFSSPLVWMLLPALLFGMGHYSPDEAGGNAIFVVIWVVVFGLLSADLTARAGTLGPSIALHMVNNMSALLIVATPDSLSGLALRTTPFSMSDTEAMQSWMWVDFAMMFVFWLAARVAIRR